jgi:type IV secretion system protein VirB6
LAIETPFTDIFAGYVENLNAASTAAADGLLGAVAPELAAALSLFVIANGVLVMLNRMQWNTAILNCLRAMFVANLLTVALYNQYVQTMFLTTIPNWIAATIGAAGNGGVPGNGIAGQFDALLAAVDHSAAGLIAINYAQGGVFNPGPIVNALSIWFAAELCEIALWIAFFVDFLATILMAVIAPIGAVVMLAYLFGNTRHWAERWIGKLVAMSLLELLVAIEVKILIVQFGLGVGKMEAATGGGADMLQAIASMWSLGWKFLFGAMAMIALPAIASAIGGSHVSNVVTTHVTMAMNAAGRAVSAAAVPAGRAAAGAAREAGRVVAGTRNQGLG